MRMMDVLVGLLAKNTEPCKETLLLDAERAKDGPKFLHSGVCGKAKKEILEEG
jgi:hypothetical protein